MKPLDSTVEVITEGFDNAESIAMRLDEHGLSHIMSVLTNLYSDPIMAVVREYSTNALDAQIEAGINRPIEITTPAASAGFLDSTTPTFTVRDFGIGLSLDDLRNIYSAYGASTKRESNLVNGMLGLGSKSALTYADTFTITSVKDGVRAIVAVHRDAHGGGTMTVMDTCATDEANGVTISVPVKNGDHKKFDETVNQFFYFWKPGTVLVNGAEPKHLTTDPNALDLDNDRYLAPARRTDAYGRSIPEFVLLMGNVGYPVTTSDNADVRKLFDNPLMSGLIVVEAPIGSFRFTPNREAPMFDNKTNEYIKGVIPGITNKIVSQIESAIAGFKTLREVNTYLKATFGTQQRAKIATLVKWNGVTVEKHMDASMNEVVSYYQYARHNDRLKFHDTYHNKSSYNNLSTSKLLQYGTENILLVTGVKLNVDSRITTTTRKMLSEYMDNNGMKYQYLYFTESPELTYTVNGSAFVAEIDNVLNWADVIEFRKAAKAAGNVGKRSVYEPKEFPEYMTQYAGYMNLRRFDEGRYTIISTSVDDRMVDHTIMDEAYGSGNWAHVIVPDNRRAKFDRLYPNAKIVTWSDSVEKARANFEARVNKDSVINYIVGQRLTSWSYRYGDDNYNLRSMVVSVAGRTDIDDPQFKEFAKLSTAIKGVDSNSGLWTYYVGGIEKEIEASLNVWTTKFDKVAKQYPLLSIVEKHLTGKQLDGIVDYINTKYNN